MSAVVLPRIGGREVYRCECGLIQFPTKDGKCRKVSCRLPFVEEEELIIPPIDKTSPIPWNGCEVTQALPSVVKILRLALGLTQRQLAEKMGKPRQYVLKVEKLRCTPQLQTLFELSTGLDTTPFAILRMCEAAA